MRPVPDPYRVLGLSPGASLDEVKRAYRRLAKQYHPDSAGDAATQRFLVVQSAYESLVSAQGPGRSAPPPGGRPAPGARPTAAGGARSGRRPPGATGDGAAGRPWEADPERSRATRDAYARYRSGRSTDRASGTWRPGARPAGWSDAPSGGAGGPEGTASSGGPGSASASAGPGRASAGGASAGRTSTGGPTVGSDAAGAGRPRGTVRKARLGTTSYDDAEARDPQWHGATWYGQASGTYWTLNPKEYADPRKHGPEYQARGRHAPGSEGGSTPDRGRDPEQGSDPDAGDRPGTAADASTGPEAEGVMGPASPPVGSASAPGTTAAGAGASWTWSQGPGARPVAGGPATMSSAAARGTATGPGRSPTTAAPGWAIRGGSGAPPSSPRDGGDRNDDARPWRELLPDRVVWALVAWPVIGLAAAGSVGQLTGCARFSASCSPGMDLAPILLQPLIIGLLLLLPRLAEVAAVGSVAVVIAAVPGAVLLSATGGSRAPAGEAPAALVAILALAWVVGVAAAVAGRARLPGTGRPSARDRH